MTKISVITINYNEPRLEKTCHSVAEQTFSDFEWIVIDGDSQSESQRVLQKYRHRMDYFISEKDFGIYNAMNKGLKQAHGEFVVFMNAGDYFYDKTTLARVAQYLNAEQGDVFYGDAVIVIPDGTLKYKCLPPHVDIKFFIQDCIAHQSSYVCRELFDKYGGYDENYKIVSDWKKWLEFSMKKVRFIPLSFLCSFQNYDGVSAVNIQRNQQERQAILDKYSLKLDPAYSLQTLFSFPASLNLIDSASKPYLLSKSQLKKKDIKVSVIVPVHNVAPYLPRCLDSLLKQEISQIEIICLDDASTDNSLQILKRYAHKDKRIAVYSFLQNVGVANARNWGMKLAQGKYVSFVDSDDSIDKNFLSNLYQQAEEQNGDVVKGRVQIFEVGGHVSDSSMNEQIETLLSKRKFLGLAWQHEFWSALYRKDFLLKNDIKFPLLSNGEDIVFILKVLSAKPKFFLNDSALYTYFKRENSASFNTGFRSMLNVLAHFKLSVEILKTASLSKDDYEAYCQYNIIEKIVSYWWSCVFAPHCGIEELQFIRQMINFVVKDMACFDTLLSKYSSFYYAKQNICLQIFENYHGHRVHYICKIIPLITLKVSFSKEKILILGIPYFASQKYQDKIVIKKFFHIFKMVKMPRKIKYYVMGVKIWHRNMTKVFVSGCFDVLHSGHVRFFEEAAQYGDLYVSIGSDKTIQELKHRQTLYNENERLYMVSALRYVHEAFIAKGHGKLDFEEELKRVKPDIFFVNSDGDSSEKRQLVENLGIRYVVSQRVPKDLLPIRSTTDIRAELHK